MSESAAEKNRRVTTFDFVRAVATIAVFVFHTGNLLSFSESGFIDWYRLVASSGTIGVSIFFVLSGFLLFYQMYKKQEALDAKKVKEYIKKRLLRILPLYYFSLFVTVFLFRSSMLATSEGIWSIIYNVLFIRGFKGLHGTVTGSIPINLAYWTLVVEMHFYVLLPLFYYFFFKYKKIAWFLALALAGILYRIMIVALVANPGMQLLRLTPANFDYFAFGMLGGYLFVQRGKWLAYIGKASVQLFLMGVCSVFVYFYNFDFLPTWSYIFAPTLFGPLVSVTMLSFLANEQSWVGKLVGIKPIVYIAQVSFGIYLWHAIVIEQFGGLALTNNLKLVYSAVATLVVASITYYAIEAPFMKLKSRKITVQNRPLS